MDLRDVSDLEDRVSLIASMRPWLVRFFRRRCRNAAEAEDLAQETIVRALSKPHWCHREKAAAYVSRVAANLLQDQMRRQTAWASVHASVEAFSAQLVEEITPERQLMAAEDLWRAVESLQELDDHTCEAFLHHRLNHVRQADIALMLGVCVRRIEKHISHAFAHLQGRGTSC